MTFRPHRRYLLASLALTLAPSGCGTLLGLDDFREGAPTGAGGSGAGGTSSVSTGGPLCTAGSELECSSYTGPQTTKNVGNCKPSVKTCAADGAGYGQCSTEVTPEPQESCKKIGDEDCDGKACSDPAWGKIFGDGKDQTPQSIAVDGLGNIVVAGSFKGTLTLSPTVTVTSSGGSDYFLAQLDPTGVPLWIKSFGDAADNAFGSAHVTINKGNEIIVVGTITGKADFGGGITSAPGGGSGDIFVAKFGQTGVFQWAQVVGDDKFQSASSVITDSNANIILCGSYQGILSFGGSGPVAANGQDGFVAKLAPNGIHLWSKRLSDSPAKLSDIQSAADVAVDTADNILIAGPFLTSISIGSIALDAIGGQDMYLAKLSPTGAETWAKSFGALGYDSAYAVAVDSTNHVILAGYFSSPGSIDFGVDGKLDAQGLYDGFIASFDSAGVHQWSKRFGAPDDNSGYPDEGRDVAIDKANNVLLTGVLRGTANFGGAADLLTSAGGSDVFVAKLDPGGTHVWSKIFGDLNDQTAGGIATDPVTSQVLLAAGVQGSINFGTESLPAQATDVGIAKFEP